MSSIRLNLHSLIVQRRLAETNDLLGKSMERLSTGLRVRTARDSPGEYGMITDQNRQVRSIQQGQNNAQNALGMLGTAQTAVQQIDDAIQRMHDLAIEAADSTLTDVQRQSLNDELTELRSGIQDIVLSTKYNDVRLLSERFEAAQIEGGTLPSGANSIVLKASESAKLESATYDFSGNSDTTLEQDIVFDLYIGVVDTDRTPDETQPTLQKVSIVVQKGLGYVAAADKMETAIEGLGGQYAEKGALHIDVTTSGTGSATKFVLSTTETGENMMIAGKGTSPGTNASTFISTYTEDKGVTNNDKLTIKVDGVQVKATIAATNYSADGAGLAKAVQDAVNNKIIQMSINSANPYAAINAVYDSSVSGSEHLILTSQLSGYLSNLEIVDGSDDLLTLLNMRKGQSDVGQGSNFEFQIGGAGDKFTFTLEEMGLTSLGGIPGSTADPGVDISSLRIDSQAAANDAVGVLEKAIAQVATSQTRLGTAATNLGRRVSILQSHEENLVAQRSRVQDVDFTEETRNFSRLQILLQAGTVALAQANLMPSTLLTLLQ